MKPSTSFLSIAALGLGGAVLLSLPACEQPPVSCTLARGDFAVKYTLIEGDDDCEPIPGEVVGVAGYNAAKEDGNPDLDALTLALRSDTMGSLIDRASSAGVELEGANQAPNAFGKFDTLDPNAAGLCQMTTLSAAQIVVPPLPAIEETEDTAGVEATEEEAIRYSWKDLAVQVTAAATGTVFHGTVTIERNACKATYKATGLYPAVYCGNDAGEPDDSLCAAEADPDAGRAEGSGINPDFKVKCDPALLLCVLDEAADTDAGAD